MGLGRDLGAGARVDLNDPELVDVVIGEIVDGRILREEPVPVDAAAGTVDRPEQLGDRRRGQQALDAEILAGEDLEVAAEDLDRADVQERGAGPARELSQLGEIEVRVQMVRGTGPLPRSGGGTGSPRAEP